MSEIFSSIWSVLTTENEMMTKIIISPTIFIEAWLVFKLFTVILKLQYNKIQEFLYIFLFSSISLILEFFVPTPYNLLINYLTMYFIISKLFKTTFLKSFICVITPTVIFALIGNLILNPFLKTFNIISDQLNTIPIYRVIYLLILYTIVYIISILIKKIKFNLSLNIFNELDSNSKRLILSNLVLGIITIIIQLVITFYYINTYSLIFTLLNFISLFAYFFISFYSLTKTMKLQTTTQDLENAENYNNTLSYLYDNVRAFHHDFDNMLFIIGGYIDNNDIDGLKKYYKSLEKDGERVNNLALLSPELINNSGIYNLLMSKYKKAHIAKVEIKLDFFFDFERLNMPIYDFSRILGILLDNAIEAAEYTDKKQVNISFRDSSKNSTQIICIENSYNNKDIDKTKIFEKGKTSKENHSGMGLWEVKQILKRNNNVVLNTTNDDVYFKQTLEIYY